MTIPNEEYPESVAECVQPMRFKHGCLAAVREFARANPWRGGLDARKVKFEEVHAALCAVYGKSTRLTFADSWQPGAGVGTSGRSHFSPLDDVILLSGKMSVVTYLHEFAHALGKGEEGAARWSINLFRILFPSKFQACRGERHMVISAATPGGGDHDQIAQAESRRLGPIGEVAAE